MNDLYSTKPRVAEDSEQYSPIRITRWSRNSFRSVVEIFKVIGSTIHVIARPVTFLIQAFHKLESPLVTGLFFSELDNHPRRLLVDVVYYADLMSLLV